MTKGTRTRRRRYRHSIRAPEAREQYRPYAIIRSRQRARGATTPWQISRFVSGRGAIAARRSNNSSGLNTLGLARAVVPGTLQLDGDAPSQLLILCKIDFAHAPTSEQTEEMKTAEM